MSHKTAGRKSSPDKKSLKDEQKKKKDPVAKLDRKVAYHYNEGLKCRTR